MYTRIETRVSKFGKCIYFKFKKNKIKQCPQPKSKVTQFWKEKIRITPEFF